MTTSIASGRRCRTAAPPLWALVTVLCATVSGYCQEAFVDQAPACGDCVEVPLAQNRGGWSWWIGADYLAWQLDDVGLPPLVTASPAGTPLDQAGVLGAPTTQILFGNEEVGDDLRSGFRVYGGVWFDCCQSCGISAEYFELDNDAFDFVQGSNANLIVTRPFFNAQDNTGDAELVSVPNELDGTVRVSGYDDFEGAAITLQKCMWRCCDPCGNTAQWNMLGGYRYYNYESQLLITENLTVLPGTTSPLVPGTQISVRDQFDARSEFHGGEIGAQGRVTECWWWLDGMAKIAIGGHRRVVVVDGQTINTVPGAGTATFAGGLLTSEVTNIGRYGDTRTAVIPELRIGLGAQLTPQLSARVGYNVIIWSDVVRAAHHLPPGLRVDPRNIPPVVAGGGPDPAFPGLLGSQLLAHGLDVGLQYNY
jgi:hypothetical protein